MHAWVKNSRRAAGANEKKATGGRFSYSGGKGGIRTHGTENRTPDFESGAFDHSATFPGTSPKVGDRRSGPPEEVETFPSRGIETFGAHFTSKPGVCTDRNSNGAYDALQAAHVGPQRRRDRHAAVGILIVLQNGHQGAPHGQR